ncbi:MAG TPA: hypothetical protein PKL46_13115 [Aquabacterium sp.]|nr:hypothetical protein [Aquabacterium sp.]
MKTPELRKVGKVFRATLFAIGLCLQGMANAVVIDFEEYGYGNSPRDVFFPMNGYYFAPMITIIDVSRDSPLYAWLGPAPSGKFIAINGANQPITISGDLFSGASLLLRSRTEGSIATANITLWNGDKQVESLVRTYGSTWSSIALSSQAATALRIATSEVSLLDDLTLPPAVVPEPAANLLLLAGLSFLYLRICAGQRTEQSASSFGPAS